MSTASALGRIWNPSDGAKGDDASAGIAAALSPGSDYWNSAQLTGDQDVIDGAAVLGANKVGVHTGALDQDTAAYGSLGDLFRGIAANGGGLTKAVGAQSAADLANTGVGKLRAADREEAGNVLAQDQAERNWAAGNATQSRAQQLATQLQKQVWNTAVSHANFESSLAAQAIKNTDRNAAYDLANSMATAAQNTQNNQQTLDRQLQAQDFKNAMATAQMIQGAAGQGLSTGTSMFGSSINPVAQSGASTGLTSGAQTYDSGYAVPTATLGTTFNAGTTLKAPTQSKYVNPITGNTVDPNMPTEASAWGDWLVSGSTLASV